MISIETVSIYVFMDSGLAAYARAPE